MGTETGESWQDVYMDMVTHVKLNNPLMGTETKNIVNYTCVFVIFLLN